MTETTLQARVYHVPGGYKYTITTGRNWSPIRTTRALWLDAEEGDENGALRQAMRRLRAFNASCHGLPTRSIRLELKIRNDR